MFPFKICLQYLEFAYDSVYIIFSMPRYKQNKTKRRFAQRFPKELISQFSSSVGIQWSITVPLVSLTHIK